MLQRPVYPAPGTSIVVKVSCALMSLGVWPWIKPTHDNKSTRNAKLRKDVIADLRPAGKREEPEPRGLLTLCFPARTAVKKQKFAAQQGDLLTWRVVNVSSGL